MLALLDDLNKELHGQEHGYRDGGASRPLVTPPLPEVTVAPGRLLDSGAMAATAPSTLAQPGKQSLPSLRFDAEVTDEGSDELGASNEAGGEGGGDAHAPDNPLLEAGTSKDPQATPAKAEQDFTFDPTSTTAKTARKRGLQGARRQTPPTSPPPSFPEDVGGAPPSTVGHDDLGKRSRRTSPIKTPQELLLPPVFGQDQTTTVGPAPEAGATQQQQQ